MRREWRHEAVILQDPITALVFGSILTTGVQITMADKQAAAADAEVKRLEKAEEDRKIEAERIARETRPEGEALESIQFGTDSEFGSVGDFLIKDNKTTSALGGTSASGLGFSV